MLPHVIVCAHVILCDRVCANYTVRSCACRHTVRLCARMITLILLGLARSKCMQYVCVYLRVFVSMRVCLCARNVADHFQFLCLLLHKFASYICCICCDRW